MKYLVLVTAVIAGIMPIDASATWFKYYVNDSQLDGLGNSTDTITTLLDLYQIAPGEVLDSGFSGEVNIKMNYTGALQGVIVNKTVTGLTPNKLYTWSDLIRYSGLSPTQQLTRTGTERVGATYGLYYEAFSITAVEHFRIAGYGKPGYHWGGEPAACTFNVANVNIDHGDLMMTVGESSTRTLTVTADCNTSTVTKRVSVFGGSIRYINNGSMRSVLLVNGSESYTDHEISSSVEITSSLVRVNEQTVGPISDARIVLVEVI